ncbi:MAG: hypothetical protein U0T83_01050 [Bacteriovoracaceae bacterium]
MVNTSDKTFQQEYSKRAQKRIKDIQRFFQMHGIDFIDIDMEHAYIDAIIKFFKRREKVK